LEAQWRSWPVPPGYQLNIAKQLGRNPLTMTDTQSLEDIFRRHGCTDFKWIDPQAIVVAQWVRMKCQYGCRHYGHIASCPPNLPTVEECRRFFDEYHSAVVFHFPKTAPDPDARHVWSAKINMRLSKLERDVFLAGNHRAFMLFMDSCHLCAECAPSRSECKKPQISRPAPEGMAVDVFTTVRQLGFPINVLTDMSQEMNRYAFLMVD
jgi:predicted metal-binding protein